MAVGRVGRRAFPVAASGRIRLPRAPVRRLSSAAPSPVSVSEFRAPDGRLYARPPKIERSRVWHCHPDEIECREGHAHIRVRETSSAIRLRVDGHLYLECPKCAGHSFAFGVITTRPHLMVTFYHVPTRAAWDELLAQPDDATTYELLVALGYAAERRRVRRSA